MSIAGGMRKMILGHCANDCNAACKTDKKECRQHYIDPIGHLCNKCIKKEQAKEKKKERDSHSTKCICYNCAQKKLREKRTRKRKARKEHADNLKKTSIQERLDF